MSSQHLSLEQVESLTMQALTGAGSSPDSASSMSKAVRAAERDGIPSHGLLYVPTYCEHVRCGKVDGNANPEVSSARLSALLVDAKTGFAHPAIEAGFKALIPLVEANGCAGMTVRNSYNLSLIHI